MEGISISFQLRSFLLLSLFGLFPVLEANGTNVTAGCIKEEREALVRFKQGLEDPSGRLSSWIGEDCCRWKGVSCNNQTGNVVKLDLRSYDCYLNGGQDDPSNLNPSCMSGKISSSLLDLKHLNYLDLSMNNFQNNPVPEFLGSLDKLSYLDLSYSNFAGLVPPHLGNLSNLRYLDLGSNSLNSSQPGIWIADLSWITHLTSLEYLNLGFVNLSMVSDHWLQAFNKLPSLTKLYLPFCELQNLPHSLPHMNFTALTVIDISSNSFQPSIPEWLFNLTSLSFLDLSYNDIRGDISVLLGGLGKCWNGSLEELYLVSNQLSGQLPSSLGFFKKLRYLYLFDNLISGPIPASVGSLLNLEGLDLSYNRLNGSIPQSMGKLTKLNALYLLQNFLEGVLSQNHFQGLRNLEYLQVSSSNKSIVFNMSSDWVPPFSLKFIRIESCNVGPSFPAWLRTQKNLSRMHINNAGISDTIPDWFWELSPQISWLDFSNNQLKGVLPNSLEFALNGNDALVDLSFNRLEGTVPFWHKVTYLNLAHNLLSGSIPTSIGRGIPSLIYLNFSGNFLNGGIPDFISEMKTLQRLDLSNNNLTGEIPEQWNHCQELLVLDLSINSLSGNIPSSIFSIPKLQWLKLNGNTFSGELSFPSVNCKDLIFLDIGENELTGKIPTWIGESLLSLSELKLRSNMFSNNIPEQLCHLSHLHVLDLADNILSGPIPSCLGNLTSFRVKSSFEPVSTYQLYPFIPQMELVVKGREFNFSNILGLLNSIDLSSNNLVGTIPEDITDLLILGTLNLSNNHFTGKIPEKMGSLRRLETLDLSYNQLSGQIPPSMSSMTLLNHLNLSHNNLSGPIPSTNQFLTFNDPSIYQGNAGLCGNPLPTRCNASNSADTENQDSTGNGDSEDENERHDEVISFSIGVGLGFVFGLLGIIGSLLLNKSWRNTYFHYIDGFLKRALAGVAKK
ncbi:receptor-like protein EIX2 [Coffea arabica]|uniref:Receptor-like protein EIX2 n=1 Tax=Coffea arabica TaxID=13443 RepID=A0A6P6TJM7_COFAR